jgi:hypothetical protein
MKTYRNIYMLHVLLLALILISGCAAPRTGRLKTEKDFQYAFNDFYFKGRAKMEVPVTYGRIDLLTHDFAIEVDRLSKFHEGIGQALHYARETGKHPGLAIFIVDPRPEDLRKLRYIRNLCELYGIKMWYINEELEKETKRRGQ